MRTTTHKHILLAGVAALAVLTLATPASAATPTTPTGAAYSNFFVFGDSLSDNGNTFAASSGVSNPAPYFNGRFSDGRTWAELLSDELGFGFGTGYTGGVTVNASTTNFAYGGAQSGNATLGLTTFPGFVTQVGSYTNATTGGVGTNTGVLGASNNTQLHAVLVGANDFIANPSTAQIPTTITNIVTGLATLRADGADNFLVLNLPGLGNTPRSRGVEELSGGTVPAIVPGNQLSNAFNSNLANTLATATNATTGGAVAGGALIGANIKIVDIESMLNQILVNPSVYGLSNVTNPCFLATAPALPNSPSTAAVAGCTDGATVNADTVSGLLFFDAIHPTATGHKIIAGTAYEALLSNAQNTSDRTATIAGMTQSALSGANGANVAVGARLTSLRAGATGFAVLGNGLSGNQYAAADGMAASGNGSPFSAYIYGGYSWGDRDATPTANAFEYDSTTYGIGGDFKVSDSVTVGTLLYYGNTDTDDQATVSKSEAKNYGFNAYALADWNNWEFDGAFGYSFDNYDDIVRATGNPFFPTATADTEGTTMSVSANTAYIQNIGGFKFGPTAGVRYTEVNIDGYAEKTGGPAANPNVADITASSLVGSLGAKASVDFNLGSVKFTPSLNAAYEKEFNNDDTNVAVTLANGTVTSIVSAVDDESVIRLGAGMKAELTDRLGASVDYDTGIRDDGSEHNVTGRVNVKF